jgi:hypothetical protein
MAKDIYVSTTGSDSGDGSQSSPFLTIQAAAKLATPGTTVHVAPGTYLGGFQTSANGTSTAHIAYVSDTPGGAKIVGGPLSNSNLAGWWNSGDYVTIKGFEVDGSNSQAVGWHNGLYLSGSYDVAEGNIVHDIIRSETQYQQSIASHTGGAGIQLENYYGGANSSAIGNIVFNIGPSDQISFEVHGIFQNQTGGTIDNNVISHVVGDGISLWHAANNTQIANNTIDTANHAAIMVGSGDNGSSSTSGDHVNVENNILVNSEFGVEESGTTGIHNIYANNLTFNDGTQFNLQHSLQARSTVNADPMFANPAAMDYHLQAGSPAIDAGTSSGAPTVDLSGSPRPEGAEFDIGAYESGSSTQQPPLPPPPEVSPDQLAIVLSEDRAGGNAQLIVKVDGAAISGVRTVTALHSKGQTETFSYAGDFSSGTHDIEVDFSNGAKSNLYINDVKWNGTSYLTASHEMTTNGAFHVIVGSN